MKKEKFTKVFVCICLSLFAISINAQENPVALLDLSDSESWRYDSNQYDTNMISVINASDAPTGIGVETENLFKFESYDIAWNEWWWCGAIVLNSPEEISPAKYNLKFKIYSPYATMIHIIVKTHDNAEITVLEQIPLEPGEWNTCEMNLSDYIGTEIERIELIPYYPAQTFYIYPYFEDPDEPVKAKGKVVELEAMEEANFEYGTNHEGSHDVSIIDIPDFLPALPVETDKVFKISTNDLDNWQFWYCAVLKVNDAKQIREDRVLVAQVYSPADRVHIILKGEDTGLLNTAFNYGERKINPNEWNEIVMDFKSYHEQTSFLQFIEVCPTLPGIDVYAYFYWVDLDPVSIGENPLQVEKSPQIIDGYIYLEDAGQISLYNTAGQLISVGTNGTVQAIDGLNIIVADGIGYKVLYNKK